MMRNLSSIAAAVLMLLSISAHAVPIWDSQDPYVFLTEGQSHTVTHDLTGYGIPADHVVTSAVLRLAFSDGVWYEDSAYDVAGISGAGISEVFEVDGTHIGGFDYRWIDVGAAGLASLNSTGKLDVTVAALYTPSGKGFNDFWWKKSKLIVDTASVPEPGTLGMLGLGLVGTAFARRLRKQ